MRDLVVRFKYGAESRATQLLGQWFLAAASQAAWIAQVDVICPVPSHWLTRLQARSHPAETLARQLSRHLQRPSRKAVHRWRLDEHQTALPFQRRASNIRGAFGIRAPARISGLRICLVDDVMTSGATTREVALLLKKAGAQFVGAAVLARGGQLGI